MMSKFNKLIEKKKKEGHGLSDVQRKAKMSVVDDMKNMANDEMNGRLSGLKKVSVASDSKSGLEKGLDKAKELVGHVPMPEDQSGPEDLHHADDEGLEEEFGKDLDHDMEQGESPEHIGKVFSKEMDAEQGALNSEEPMDADDIDAQIQHLLALKEKMKAPKA